MPGYIDRNDGAFGFFGNISKSLKKLSSLGIEYDDLVVQNSMSIGTIESEFSMLGYIPKEFSYSLAFSDINAKKYIVYFDKEYKSKREYLRRFALNSEIDSILDIICDEAIVYDNNNYFCYLDSDNLQSILDAKKYEDLKNYLNDEFKRIYSLFNFNTSNDAWYYFKKYLIDGAISFEIIYDSDGKKIIGFKEIDAATIRPGSVQEEDGIKKVWVQYDDNPVLKRQLYDAQVIYVSYAKSNFFQGRISYIERLIRSFNLLRIMENSRIIWNIMNSSFRLKMIVPIGTKSKQKAMESLGELMAFYKEDIALDLDSGELSINGRPGMQFYKNYLFPSKDGESPDISVMGGEGPDLSDTEALRYFYDKLIADSNVPYTRFSKDNTPSVSFDASSITRDEIKFSRFILRLRSTFQEILLKPLVIQLMLDFPEFENNQLIKNNIGIKFNSDNLFEQLKRMEVIEKSSDFIKNLSDINLKYKDKDGNDVEEPYFDMDFLVKKFLGFTDDELELNKKMKEKLNKKEDDEEKEEKKNKKGKDKEGGDIINDLL